MKICKCAKLRSLELIKALGYKLHIDKTHNEDILVDSLGVFDGDDSIVPIYEYKNKKYIISKKVKIKYYEYLSEYEISINECKELKPQFFI